MLDIELLMKQFGYHAEQNQAASVLVLGSTLFAGFLPEKGFDALGYACILFKGAKENQSVQDHDREEIRIQVFSRGQDYFKTLEKAQSVHNVFAKLQNQELDHDPILTGSIQIHELTTQASQAPMYGGKEEKGHWFSANYIFYAVQKRIAVF